MIEDRMIDGKIMLSDLLAQAVCMGVRAGRNQIEYRGPWPVARDILNETEEVLSHRDRVLGIRAAAVELNNLMKVEE